MSDSFQHSAPSDFDAWPRFSHPLEHAIAAIVPLRLPRQLCTLKTVYGTLNTEH